MRIGTTSIKNSNEKAQRKAVEPFLWRKKFVILPRRVEIDGADHSELHCLCFLWMRKRARIYDAEGAKDVLRHMPDHVAGPDFTQYKKVLDALIKVEVLTRSGFVLDSAYQCEIGGRRIEWQYKTPDMFQWDQL